MIVILGLVILLAAVIIGAAGVLGNARSAHALSHGFAVFGYHVTGSTDTLFLAGMEQSRQQTAAVSQDRDDPIDQREATRTYTASTPGHGTPRSGPRPRPGRPPGQAASVRAPGRFPPGCGGNPSTSRPPMSQPVPSP